MVKFLSYLYISIKRIIRSDLYYIVYAFFIDFITITYLEYAVFTHHTITVVGRLVNEINELQSYQLEKKYFLQTLVLLF